ncbi:MAG: hypothetical protein AAF804_15660 [Bacteroidota bacterium]
MAPLERMLSPRQAIAGLFPPVALSLVYVAASTSLRLDLIIVGMLSAIAVVAIGKNLYDFWFLRKIRPLPRDSFAQYLEKSLKRIDFFSTYLAWLRWFPALVLPAAALPMMVTDLESLGTLELIGVGAFALVGCVLIYALINYFYRPELARYQKLKDSIVHLQKMGRL